MRGAYRLSIATVRTGQRICCADREKGDIANCCYVITLRILFFQRALSTVLQKEYTVSSASQGRYQNRISSALPRFVRWPVRPSRKNRRKMPAGFRGKALHIAEKGDHGGKHIVVESRRAHGDIFAVKKADNDIGNMGLLQIKHSLTGSPFSVNASAMV